MRILLLLSIFICQISYGRTCSCDSLFNNFKNDIQMELSIHGHRVVWDDETRISYNTLMIFCPTDSLVKYVDDSIPAIRCLIFSGLVLNKVNKELLNSIYSKHKNDTGEYLDSPTDAGTTWTVSEYMKFFLEVKIPETNSNFKSRLKSLQRSLHKYIYLKLPGEHHGIIPKDSLLTLDSLSLSKKEWRVISFRISIGVKNFSTMNIFTEEIKNNIRAMKYGERLLITDIRIEDKNKRWRTLASKFLIVR